MSNLLMAIVRMREFCIELPSLAPCVAEMRKRIFREFILPKQSARAQVFCDVPDSKGDDIRLSRQQCPPSLQASFVRLVGLGPAPRRGVDESKTGMTVRQEVLIPPG